MKPPEGGREFALLGSPVSHSVSPAIHAGAFRALGIAARYVAVEVTAEELPEALRRFAASGGGNVTLPHKTAAAALLDRRTAVVKATGACNCFWPARGGEVAGDNADVEAFLQAARRLRRGRRLAGSRVLLVGAGGGARAVLAGCLREGAAAVDVENRTASRAREMVEEVARGDRRVRVLAELGDARGPYDLVVNATSLGLRPGDPLPPAPERCDAAAALDLAYGPEGTPWVRRARRRGIPAMDGTEMLVRQAALSLRRWWPGIEPPVAAMRRAAGEALRRRGAVERGAAG